MNFTKIKNEVISLAEGIESVFLAGITTLTFLPMQVIHTLQFMEQRLPGMRMAMSLLMMTLKATLWYADGRRAGKIGDVSPDFMVGLTNTLSISG